KNASRSRCATITLRRLLRAPEMAPHRLEALVPACAHFGHPRHRLAERRRRQLVARLATLTRRGDETGLRERCELLRDRLPRHRQPGRELGRRGAPARRDLADEVPPARVAQRGEDAVYRTGIHARAWS